MDETRDEPEGRFAQSQDLVVAAHALFTSDRAVSANELLISTAMGILADGAMSLDALLAGCNSVWPGADIDIDRLTYALESARPLGLVASGSDLVGETWSVTESGNEEALATRTWYADAIGRLASDIRARAEDDFGVVTHEQVELWTAILVDALMTGVWTSEGVLRGKVSRGLSTTDLRPMGLNPRAMLGSLDDRTMDPEILEFLKACILSAIDESDPLANEVVTYIAVAGTLHAVAAGRDRSPAQSMLGAISGQRVVVDTPVLLAAMGGVGEAEATRRLFASCVSVGLDIVVPNHVIDELESVLDRVERDSLPGLRQALADGMRPAVYRELVDEQVLQMYLDAVRDDQAIRSWEQWRLKTKEVVASLSTSGVDVRDHGNLDDDSVDECRSALRDELDRRNKSRGVQPINRDAHSMAMVRRSRNKHRRFESSFWPGGWILSLDTYLGPAYANIDPTDEASLTISPSSLTILVAECAEPPSVRALVTSAASHARREAMISIAMRYPPDVALDFSRHLTGDYSATDSRIAQLRFDEVIDRNSGHPSLTGARLASDLTAKRMKRMRLATEAQQARLRAEASEADAARRESQTRLDSERAVRRDLQRTFANQTARSSSDLDDERLLSRRRTITAVLVTVGICAALAFLLSGHVWTAIGTLLAAAVLAERARDWCASIDRSWAPLLFAALPSLLGVIDVVMALRGK